MKTLKYFFIAVFAIFLWGCSEDVMDDINRDRNNASEIDAFAVLPDAILKSAVASATDLAWFSSQWAEHSAGQWAQSHDDDRRIGMNATSNFNNSWVGGYDRLNILKVIRERCSPGGPEENNKHALGIAQILTAYNLAMMTDFFGEMPWTEALQGAAIPQPKYDKQSFLYSDDVIFKFLTDGIANLELAIAQGSTGPNAGTFDYIYAGSNAKWIKAAYSLKARLHMRLTQRDANAATKALAALANGFASAADNFLFAKYEASQIGENPWYQYKIQRSHLAVSETLFDLMDDRSDPRIPVFFTQVGGVYNPAPSGEADRIQGGQYSESKLADNRTAVTPMMTFHELKFIEAEAQQRAGGDFTTPLQAAIRASFVYHGLTEAAADTYFTNEVDPRLTANALDEILTQKYIAMYEAEAMEAYHQVRRTGVPAMRNPNNLTAGFPNRCPGGNSEESNNPTNFIVVDVLTQKIWWAGGAELIP
jgi:hypothetical protein